ncbi:actin cytoskeleton-regulatory complex protein pan-1-like [Felis catus]|uniref:actin cytoskeleton-regulatory complex protein pan-1-like n=1 Tax=Felis catus TaxID=9685 RepID=UPI001D1A04D8|nr:actin cytoskeleton-regulatory complex protein pan-1-like [Felis catus]
MEGLREPLRVDTRLAVRGQMRSVGVRALNGKRVLCGGQACALVRGLGRPSCARGVGCPDVLEAAGEPGGDAARRRGLSPLPQRHSAWEGGDRGARCACEPPAPRTEVPGAPKATRRRLRPRLKASDRGGGDSGGQGSQRNPRGRRALKSAAGRAHSEPGICLWPQLPPRRGIQAPGDDPRKNTPHLPPLGPGPRLERLGSAPRSQRANSTHLGPRLPCAAPSSCAVPGSAPLFPTPPPPPARQLSLAPARPAAPETKRPRPALRFRFPPALGSRGCPPARALLGESKKSRAQRSPSRGGESG